MESKLCLKLKQLYIMRVTEDFFKNPKNQSQNQNLAISVTTP
jgi:hypothetical protein